MLYYTKNATLEVIKSLDDIIGVNNEKANRLLCTQRDYFSIIPPFIDKSETEDILGAIIDTTHYLATAACDKKISVNVPHEYLYNYCRSVERFEQELFEFEFDSKRSFD